VFIFSIREKVPLGRSKLLFPFQEGVVPFDFFKDLARDPIYLLFTFETLLSFRSKPHYPLDLDLERGAPRAPGI